MNGLDRPKAGPHLSNTGSDHFSFLEIGVMHEMHNPSLYLILLLVACKARIFGHEILGLDMYP